MHNRFDRVRPGRGLGLVSILTSVLVMLLCVLSPGAQSSAQAQEKPGKPATAAAKGKMQASTAKTTAVSAEHGKYLVNILGCNDCHTPLKMGANGPEPDMSRMLSGHPGNLAMPPVKMPDMPWAWVGSATMTAFAGPWGTTFAPNLTPDGETGTGAWDEALFVKIFRTGKWMGSDRPIMPPMPIQAFSNLTDNDLKSIFAYLKTIPAIKNKAPDFIPAAPGGGMGEGH